MSASPVPTPAVGNDVFAKDLAAAMQGKLDDDKLGAAVAAVSAATTAYPAAAWFASFLFYLHVECQITGDIPRFRGNAGGLWSPVVGGAGGFFGNVYTDDKDKLYQQTHAFELHSLAVYVGITFWDGSSNLLGHFESGGIGSLGIGGGTGAWSA
jgi:Rhodococcus equi virulence-associated protein